MNNARAKAAPLVQRIHETTFSATLAVAVMAAVFLFAPSRLTDHLFDMEAATHRLLHMEQTDFRSGHIAFFLPATLAAFCIWLILHSFAPTAFAKWLLHSVSGLVALAVVPSWWLALLYQNSHRSGWSPIRAPQTYELLAVIVCAFLYLGDQLPMPAWAGVTIVLAHNAFWVWQLGPYRPSIFVYDWQVGFGISLFAALAWMAYLGAQPQERQRLILPRQVPERAPS